MSTYKDSKSLMSFFKGFQETMCPFLGVHFKSDNKKSLKWLKISISRLDSIRLYVLKPRKIHLFD